MGNGETERARVWLSDRTNQPRRIDAHFTKHNGEVASAEPPLLCFVVTPEAMAQLAGEWALRVTSGTSIRSLGFLISFFCSKNSQLPSRLLSLSFLRVCQYSFPPIPRTLPFFFF
ncbi:hypothetical protein FF1_043618 [Malus domestica]